MITFLRKSTNNFLGKLENIYYSNESSETKLKHISTIVDELPWDELDTEEREFQIDFERDRCRTAAVESGGDIKCSNFNVIRKLPTTFTTDGYPKITTVISTTNDYPEYLVLALPIAIFVSAKAY